MTRICIQNARIATAKADFIGDVLIENGVIAQIGEGGLQKEAKLGAEIIDAADLVLLPGGVDAHTHFDLDVGFTRASDDFYTGSIAAACGGTTSVVDHMAFGPKGCPLSHQVQVYHGLAQDAVIDYGFHGVIQHVDEQVLADMETLLETEGISSYKAYMTYDYALHDGDLMRVLARARELGLVICAHCENDEMIQALRQQCEDKGQLSPRYHPLSRPTEAEAEAVFRLLMLARAAGNPDVYVVHLSSAQGLDALRLARTMGSRRIWAETCPQYLFLDDSRYSEDAAGLRHIMCPPLRKQADMDALWQAIGAGEINVIGTDHCPFTDEQKARGKTNFMLCPSGAPGVELRMPLLFSEGFLAGRLTLPQLVQICCKQPAEIFGLAPRKGDITVGADADLVLFDPAVDWTVHKAFLHESVDYSLYEGKKLKGRSVLTMSRGEIIVRDNVFCGTKGRGQYIKRKSRRG